MPNMTLVFFNDGDNLPHFPQHFGLLFVVNIALQKLEHVEAIFGIADERGK